MDMELLTFDFLCWFVFVPEFRAKIYAILLCDDGTPMPEQQSANSGEKVNGRIESNNRREVVIHHRHPLGIKCKMIPGASASRRVVVHSNFCRNPEVAAHHVLEKRYGQSE